MEVRHAHPDEREDVAQFLYRYFGPKVGSEAWRELIDGRWGRPGDSFGVSLLDGPKLVGFLGMVPAERPTAGGLARTANMTSWYLEAPYRGLGYAMEMLKLALADPEITVTDFSSVPHLGGILKKAGLAILDDRRLIWRADPAGGGPLLRAIPAPQAVPGLLGERDAAILRDHAGLNLTPVAVETPAGLCLLVLSIKQKHEDYVTHEVLYLGNADAFRRHARAVARAILPPERAVLSVDRRFLGEAGKAGEEAGADAVEKIPVPRFYLPGLLAAADIDFLYSETVLLDLKLY